MLPLQKGRGGRERDWGRRRSNGPALLPAPAWAFSSMAPTRTPSAPPARVSLAQACPLLPLGLCSPCHSLSPLGECPLPACPACAMCGPQADSLPGSLIEIDLHHHHLPLYLPNYGMWSPRVSGALPKAREPLTETDPKARVRSHNCLGPWSLSLTLCHWTSCLILLGFCFSSAEWVQCRGGMKIMLWD